MGKLKEPGRWPWRKPGRGSGDAPLNRAGGRASKIVGLRGESLEVIAANTYESKVVGQITRKTNTEQYPKEIVQKCLIKYS